MINSIEVKSLCRNFGSFKALQDVSLVVKPGETLALFGHNGAGKTTLLKVMSTVMKPSSGSVEYGGRDIHKDSGIVRANLGVISHRSFLYSSLTAYDNLVFYSKLYGVVDREKRIKQLLSSLGLKARMYDKVGTYSRGMQQKLSIARALLHQPGIVLMDEPESGLDNKASESLWKLLSEEQRTVVFTHHNLEKGFAAADRVMILSRGKVFFAPDGKCSLAELQDAYSASLETA
ncbi:MAG: ABC transporter ATP-binding protein [Dehalococcoidales bacterium]|jgi:heme exporter protein A|nr:ABC transporter ATP-binding protein [Dehalococcoidales bacterium]MDD3265076.1 ABC transporter ATP-binding protein [Dehalococcoidales bacterium]MDD4322947.1 ABC transporter ATP-binding protein [Dehalococcoidales bacterium]MDD4794597.1 ABC transporter ATP-binding protein [Dehalococcoidales bacterium]MDD5498803.1 ABC transporter ATP-binding protein [Dehalococcoidales bacterium]